MGDIVTGLLSAGGVIAAILWALWLMVSGAKEDGKVKAQQQMREKIDESIKVHQDTITAISKLSDPDVDSKLQQWATPK